MASLSERNVLDMIEAPDEDRRFSIGSNTDAELNRKRAFAEKQTEAVGSPVDPTKNGLGFTCRKGLKPESPNQDSWMILQMGRFSIYGVFDGHGKTGHHVSNFVKDALPKVIVKDQRFRTEDMLAMLVDAYKRVQNMIASATRAGKIDAHLSGCTTTVIVHDHERKRLHVSHVGDSGAILGVNDQAGRCSSSHALTWDHKPEIKVERQRIEGNNGRVVFDGYCNHRVYSKNGRYPGLNMSRALGDLMGNTDAGISAVPTVSIHDLRPEDHVIILCSDGVWEFMSYDEAVNLVARFPREKAMEGAAKLAKDAWDRWILEEGGTVVDDITAVLVYLGD